MDKNLNYAIDNKSYWYSKLRKNPNNKFIQDQYCKFKKTVKLLLTKNKQTYYEDKLNAADDLRKKWMVLKDIMYGQPTINKCVLLDGVNDTHNKLSKLNEFNSYYANIGEVLAKNFNNIYTPSARSQANAFSFEFSTFDDITNIVAKLKNSNSCGADDIHTKVIKDNIQHLATPIMQIIKNSLKQGVVPSKLKVAKIVPIYKAGERNLVKNFRPICILPIIDKILEKVVKHQLMAFIDDNDLISNFQYGFKKKSNTNTALFDVVHSIQNSMDLKLKTCAIFFDLTKAFDTVDRKILINKLYEIGIVNNELNWFKSYLEDRFQYTQVGQLKSVLNKVSYGVPQGSVQLGHILFIIYVNDLTKLKLNGKVYLYADDITIVYSAKSLDMLQSLINADLLILFDWMSNHALTVNAEKTKYMLFGENVDTCLNLVYNNSNISKTTEHKYLGVLFDNCLNWKAHIKSIKSKVVPLCGVFRRISKVIPFRIKRTIFFALFHPYILYGIPIWGNTFKKYILELQRIQNRAIKNLYKFNYLKSTSVVHMETKIPTVMDNYNISVAVHISNILHRQINSSTTSLIPQNSNRSSHKLKNIKIRTTKYGSNGVLHGAISVFNSLKKDLAILPPKKLRAALKKDFQSTHLNIQASN